MATALFQMGDYRNLSINGAWTRNSGSRDYPSADIIDFWFFGTGVEIQSKAQFNNIGVVTGQNLSAFGTHLSSVAGGDVWLDGAKVGTWNGGDDATFVTPTGCSGLAEGWHHFQYILSGMGQYTIPRKTGTVGQVTNGYNIRVTGAAPALSNWHAEGDLGTLLPLTWASGYATDYATGDPSAVWLKTQWDRFFQSGNNGGTPSSGGTNYYWLFTLDKTKNIRSFRPSTIAATGKLFTNTVFGADNLNTLNETILYDGVSGQNISWGNTNASRNVNIFYRASNAAQKQVRLIGVMQGVTHLGFGGQALNEDALAAHLVAPVAWSLVGTSLTVHNAATEYPHILTASLPLHFWCCSRGTGGSSLVPPSSDPTQISGFYQKEELAASGSALTVYSHYCNDVDPITGNAAVHTDVIGGEFGAGTTASVDKWGRVLANGLNYVYANNVRFGGDGGLIVLMEMETVYKSGTATFTSLKAEAVTRLSTFNIAAKGADGNNPFHASGDYAIMLPTDTWRGTVTLADGVHPNQAGAVTIAKNLLPSWEVYLQVLDPAETPSISPSGGAVPLGQQITLSSPTPGAVIYYTVDGTDPDNTDAVYNPAAKPTLNSAGTVDFRAIAYASGYSASVIAYATFDVQAFTPTSPVPYIVSLTIPSDGAAGSMLLSESATGNDGFAFIANGFPLPATVSGSGQTRTVTFGRTVYQGEVIRVGFDSRQGRIVDADSVPMLSTSGMVTGSNNSTQNPSGNWAIRAKPVAGAVQRAGQRRNGIFFESDRWRIVVNPAASIITDPGLFALDSVNTTNDSRLAPYPVLNPQDIV